MGDAFGAKGRLLRAAGAFGVEGYSEVSVAQIIGNAGVQPPTLYHHFGDKEGLFVAWAIGSLESHAGLLASAASESVLREGLAKIAEILTDPRFPDLILLTRDLGRLERPESKESVRDAVQRAVYEPLYQILLAGMSLGAILPEPVHSTSAVFITGAVALRPGGLLDGMGSDAGPEWWVGRFLAALGPR